MLLLEDLGAIVLVVLAVNGLYNSVLLVETGPIVVLVSKIIRPIVVLVMVT